MKKRILITILSIALILSGFTSVLSVYLTNGYSRVINYAGIVRGATQRLVKKELNGYPDDELMQNLDRILNELQTGKGDNDLIRLNDRTFQHLLAQMEMQWTEIQEEIVAVRNGKEPSHLYTLSEDYFELADTMVSAAEVYTNKTLHSASIAFVIMFVVFIIIFLLLRWYEALQAKQRRALTQAESLNLKRSQDLSQMSKDIKAPLDDILELIYVSRTDNHELLFINSMGRRAFGIDDYRGQKCYKVLQNSDKPCSFCSTPYLKKGENFDWVHTNSVTGRHYLLKDHLVEWEGAPARMEIAIDITESENQKRELTWALDIERMIMECVRTLYQCRDFPTSINSVLKQIGEFFEADRTYIFSLTDHLLYNDYEWCSEGIPPQKDFLQELSDDLIEHWRIPFKQQDYVVVDNLESIRDIAPDTYELLSSQGIHNLVAAPLEANGELTGFLGLDNPPSDKLKNIGSFLQTLCYFILLARRRTENESELARLSFHDTLTSFYNRNRYTKDLKIFSGKSTPVGVVYLDVNGLKDINDTQGHAVGDKTLIECANRMKSVLHNGAFYRIGGDEFVCICENIPHEAFEERVRKLRLLFIHDKLCKAAIGAQWSSQAHDIAQIISDADAKMYEDKKKFYRSHFVSNRYRHHNDELLYLTEPQTLQQKISSGQFIVQLQPKISAGNTRSHGAEALIRYLTEDGTLVPPIQFLPLLEEAQTVHMIDFFVFETVCSAMQKWQKDKRQFDPISVNFSRYTLAQPTLVDSLLSTCSTYNIAPQLLEIEITETVSVVDGTDIGETIANLRNAGFIVSIDDFGTEYSNISFLLTLDFDVLKLDKSLVDNVARSNRAQIIITSVASICSKVGIQLVAEGVESKEQLDTLQRCGVSLVQGYLFSRPIPIDQYEKNYLID